MNKGVVAISALAGVIAAIITCVAFFYFANKPAHSGDVDPRSTPTQAPGQTPRQTPVNEIPNPEIKATDVKAISINTVYKGFFDPGDKCAKTYNEYFGNDDGIASPSSPCTIKISFDRDGHAARSIEISRWDKAAKEKRPVEKTDTTADITLDQFDKLAQSIVSNKAFRDWRESTMITVSNCSISVAHAGGIKSVMSNVDEKTTVYLEMINAIKQLEKELKWHE